MSDKYKYLKKRLRNSKPPFNFYERKQHRTEYYFKYEFGWKLRDCGACNGSGRYDHNGSPKCSCCDGTGKERYKPTGF